MAGRKGKPPAKGMDALLFIDANIFLNFYRTKDASIGMQFLEQIEACKERLILSSQLEMEYKKNRQAAVIAGMGNFGKADWSKLESPAITSDTQAARAIVGLKKKIDTQQRKVSTKIQRILESPGKHDAVYQVLQRVFKHKSPYNLDREDKRRFQIRDLAQKRFSLGYPPRKLHDTSLGDAIHWEWIVQCSIDSHKDIVIVSRDSDFGRIYNGKSFLNDWLSQEFRQRVSHKRKILLTPSLANGLKEIHAKVTAEMQEQEQRTMTDWEKSFSELDSEPDVEELAIFAKWEN